MKSKPALNNLNDKLLQYIDFDKGFFIEVGANDGYTQSNTYYYEKERGWNGLLIEAIPELYERCTKQRPNSKVVNCGLVEEGFRDKNVKMHWAGLMSTVEGALKTDTQQAMHIKTGLDIQHLDHTYEIEIPARTLTSVLANTADLPEIDFFSLDVEGYELQVLRGLDLERFAPRFILVEARFFDEVNNHLIEHYDLIDQLSVHDFLYRRKDVATN